MKIENLSTYIVRSGSVLCFSASAVAAASSILFDVPIDIKLLIIAFLVTFSSYYVNRKVEIEQDRISHPARTKFIEKNRVLDFLAVIAIGIAIYFSLEKNIESLIIAMIPPISVLLYSVSLHKKIKRFKDITWLKTSFVSLVWTGNVFLTAVYNNVPLSTTVFVMAIFVFFRIFIDCIIFDMRDVIADKLYSVRTIPIALGEDKSIQLMVFLNAAVGVFIFVAAQIGLVPYFAHSLNIITLYGFYYIGQLKNPKMDKHFLCDIIVDGEYIIWPFLLIIGKILLS